MSPLSILLTSHSLLVKRRKTGSCIYPILKQISNCVSNSLTDPLAMYKDWSSSRRFFAPRALRYVARNRYSSPL
jgi:hypothetical protein